MGAAASKYDADHRCNERDCPFKGQKTSSHCGCHKSRETVLRERIAELEYALEECEGHFENRSDVIDGDYGQPEANAEMTMLGIVQRALNSKVLA